jgi:hypothetical protein
MTSNRIRAYESAKCTAPTREKTRWVGDSIEFWHQSPQSKSKRPVAANRLTLESALAALLEERNKSLETRLDATEAKVERLIQSLERGGQCLPINTLSQHGLEVIKAICAHVRLEDEDEYVASFADANINGSGETEHDAYEDLKAAIAGRYFSLTAYEKDLGKEPARQLAVLREFVRAN